MQIWTQVHGTEKPLENPNSADKFHWQQKLLISQMHRQSWRSKWNGASIFIVMTKARLEEWIPESDSSAHMTGARESIKHHHRGFSHAKRQEHIDSKVTVLSSTLGKSDSDTWSSAQWSTKGLTQVGSIWRKLPSVCTECLQESSIGSICIPYGQNCKYVSKNWHGHEVLMDNVSIDKNRSLLSHKDHVFLSVAKKFAGQPCDKTITCWRCDNSNEFLREWIQEIPPWEKRHFFVVTDVCVDDSMFDIQLS
jgi:hypothetical protein